jgi:uncharacterized protein (DUF697 family)
MAAIGQARKFWKTTKEVSVGQIVREAEKPFSVAVVGRPERRAEVMRHLFPGIGGEDVVPERSLVRAFDSTSGESGFPADADSQYLIIDAGGGRAGAPLGAPIYSVEELGGWERVVERILDQRPDIALSLARRFPGLRHEVAERVIRDTALANAEFAMLNALPGVIPIIAPLLPAAAIGDIFMLTKNQAMMLYRLAAIHELPLDLRARSRDLGPLLGNAFGWRAIAREVVGAVPGGIGLVARGTIAYAGTVALGRALLKLYETGQQPTRAQITRLYKEAYAGAKETVKGLLKKRGAGWKVRFQVREAEQAESEKQLPPAR